MIKYDLLNSFAVNFHNKIVCRISSNIFWCRKIKFCNKNKRNVKFSTSNK